MTALVLSLAILSQCGPAGCPGPYAPAGFAAPIVRPLPVVQTPAVAWPVVTVTPPAVTTGPPGWYSVEGRDRPVWGRWVRENGRYWIEWDTNNQPATTPAQKPVSAPTPEPAKPAPAPAPKPAPAATPTPKGTDPVNYGLDLSELTTAAAASGWTTNSLAFAREVAGAGTKEKIDINPNVNITVPDLIWPAVILGLGLVFAVVIAKRVSQ